MFKIEIRTGGSAYDEYPHEIIRNLKSVIAKIEADADYDHGSIIDINGNKTGEWSITQNDR